MKLLKLLLVFGLLCKSIDAETNSGKSVDNGKNVSFSVEELWQSYRKGKCSCRCPCEEKPWLEGVQASVDGCREAASAFRGEAYKMAETVVNSLQEFVTKLIDLDANANSTIISACTTAILTTASRGKDLNGSSMNVIVEYDKILSAIVEDFNDIVNKTLSVHIGELSNCFIDAASEHSCVFSKFMKDFQESCRLFNCKKEVDFKPVLKTLQKLMNIVALISETLLNKCDGKATQEVYDSVFVLNLLYFYLELGVPGVNSCVEDVLFDRKCPIPKPVQSCSLTFEYANVQITQALSKVVFPFDKSIKDLLKTFVNTTSTLNAAVRPILGLADSVRITVPDITKNLLKSAKFTVVSTERIIKILKGLSIK